MQLAWGPFLSVESWVGLVGLGLLRWKGVIVVRFWSSRRALLPALGIKPIGTWIRDHRKWRGHSWG